MISFSKYENLNLCPTQMYARVKTYKYNLNKRYNFAIFSTIALTYVCVSESEPPSFKYFWVNSDPVFFAHFLSPILHS